VWAQWGLIWSRVMTSDRTYGRHTGPQVLDDVHYRVGGLNVFTREHQYSSFFATPGGWSTQNRNYSHTASDQRLEVGTAWE